MYVVHSSFNTIGKHFYHLSFNRLVVFLPKILKRSGFNCADFTLEVDAFVNRKER